MANEKVCRNCKHWREEANGVGHCGHPDNDQNLALPFVAYESDTCEGWEDKDPRAGLLERLTKAGPGKKRKAKGRGLF